MIPGELLIEPGEIELNADPYYGNCVSCEYGRSSYPSRFSFPTFMK